MNKVIFWDFDGTLVYANSSFRDSLNEALKTQPADIEGGKAAGMKTILVH